jgi:GNAT superfamily N-acetyltransferase
MDPSTCRQALEWGAAEGVQLLYFLADDDVESWSVACDAGFRPKDIRVEMALDRTWPRLPGPGVSNRVALREAVPADLTDLLPIASSAHTDSRFFADAAVSRDKAHELYEVWLTRSVEKTIADVVFVAEIDGRAVSYITARIADHVGSIGLVGVGESARGRGVGMAMVQHTLQWFTARNVRGVTVVTQGRNVMAQRVYQRCGFLTSATRLWFHRWFQ